MTRTEILGLAKRESKEKYNLEQNNANMDIIDTFADVLVQATPTVPATAEGNAIVLNNSSDKELIGFTIYGSTTQNGTPTPTAPVDLDSIENPTVTINGKNLLNSLLNLTATTVTKSGVTFVVNADKSISINGTATATIYMSIARVYAHNIDLILSNGDYTSTKNGIYIHGRNNDGTVQTNLANSCQGKYSFNSGDYDFLDVGIVVQNRETISTTFYPMLRLASITDSTYEPYKAQSISIPYTLNEGDYVDFEKSVLVKKTETYQLTSAMTWAKNSANTRIYTILPDGIEKATNSNIYCTHAVKGSWANSTSGTVCLGNSATPVCGFATSDFATVEELKSWLDSQTDGVFIVVPLITPTETPLTAEEIEAFRQLQSYNPVTTITNSENAEMSVGYRADTKTVLKEKLSILTNS